MINDTSTISISTDKTLYTLPKFLSQIEHITTVDNGGVQFLACADKLKLYIFPLIQGGTKPLGTVHQSLHMPNIKTLRAIAKNFLLIETQNKYLGIFQIIKSTNKQIPTDKPVNPLQANMIKVQFCQVLKWKAFSSYFIREVMENLFEVQVFFTDLEFEIFHFTNKNKKGSMSFTISQNGRILKSNKRQLYGSKFFFNIGRKLIYWMKNFSDKQFILQQIVVQQPMGSIKLQPFGYFGVQRAEQYKMLSANLVVRDCLNPAKRHSLEIEANSFLNDLKAQLETLSPTSKRKNANQQENPFHELVQRDGITQLLETYKLTIFTDLLMVENKQKKKMEIYQIRTEGSSIVGKQDSYVQLQKDDPSMLDLRRWQWFFGNSRKLIAYDKIGLKIKYVHQMTLRERGEQIKESPEIKNINQTENQKAQQNMTQTAQKEKQKEKSEQVAEKDQSGIKGRKFYKVEIKKYSEEINENTLKPQVDEDLIKKVDEVNQSLCDKPLQKIEQSMKSIQKLNESETLLPKNNTVGDISKRESSIQVQKQEKRDDKKPEQKNIESEKNKENPLNQEQKVVKQKPPMKIIQKNKISVAKSFQNQLQNQSKQKNQAKKQQKEGNDSQIIENQKIEKASQQNSKVVVSNYEEQKKKFIQNYLNQEKKQIQNQQKEKQTEKSINQAESKAKESKSKQEKKEEKKQEKKKINVITRASLMKKKQNEESKEPQTNILPEKQQAKVIIEQPQIKNEKQLEKQESVQSSVVNPVQVENKKQNEEQQKPKTRYIPSIDIKKASVSQLNECQFLSEDSVSQQDEDIQQQNQKKKVILQEDEEIQQQIEGQSGYSSGEEDMEHLIDDDITTNVKKQPVQSSHQEINPDEEIQKFCNNLLQENTDMNYKKTVTATSSIAIKKCSSHNENILVKTQKIQKSISIQGQMKKSESIVSELEKKASKQQTNEINQLNSLLFKTSIKRNNIFGSDQKSEQSPKHLQVQNKTQKESGKEKLENNEIINEALAEKKPMISQKQNEQAQKKQQTENLHTNKKKVEEKKSKVWHDLSSDSDDERSSSQNEETSKNQHIIPQKQESETLPKEQQSITKTLEKIKIVEQQCTKILSDIEQHKAKQIQEKLFQEKPIQQTHTQKIVPQTSESKEILKNPLIQQNKENPFNPFLSSSQIPNFPTNITSNWLSHRPPANMIQKKDQNPFINFKKSIQQTQTNHHNLFGLGENGNSNSSTLFRKFLNQRQTKTQEIKQGEIKTIEQTSIFDKKQPEEPMKIEKTEVKVNQGLSISISEPSLIPTTLLPKIQQLISTYEQSTLNLLQKQQSTILKSLQEIPNTHNPYNKNHSLLLPEQIKEEIIKQSKNTVKKWLATKMLDKIESSFRQIMQQHKKVYEDALKYYESEAKRRITTMQLQYEQQQTILTDIENVAANLSSALQGSVLEGEQMHTFQLKQWKKQIIEVQTNLVQPMNQKIQDSKQFFNERNKKLQNLGSQLSEIKQILKNKLKRKQQLKELKEKKKQQLEQQLKQRENKKGKKIIQEPKKLKTQRVKNETQTSFAQYCQIPQYEHQTQYYPRPSYPYY